MQDFPLPLISRSTSHCSSNMHKKRRDLSIDDLLRMQDDGPVRKRRREDFVRADLHSDEDEDSGSSGSDSTGEEEAEGVDGSDESSDDGGEDSDEASGSDVEAAQPDLQPEPEDAFSRVSILPRTSHAVPRNTLKAPPILPASYTSMGISSALLSSLNKMSIKTPTEIQAACIPPLLAGESSRLREPTGADIRVS